MSHNQMMMLNKFLSINQNLKKRNFKEELEAEWEFHNKCLVASIKNKVFNLKKCQNLNKPNYLFLV